MIELPTEMDNLASLGWLRTLAAGDALTASEREGVRCLEEAMLKRSRMDLLQEWESRYRLPRWAPVASVALSTVAFVVSLVAVFA